MSSPEIVVAAGYNMGDPGINSCMTQHMTSPKMVKKDWWAKAWFWSGLLVSWIGLAVFLLFPVVLVFWLVALVILFLKRSSLTWYLIFLSGWLILPACHFLSGTKDYFTGQGTLWYMGMPGPDDVNPDPVYRCRMESSGCVVIGYEVFTQIPNNAAVKMWTRLLGYQKGAYAGYYPTYMEADSIITAYGQPASCARVGNTCHFYFNGRNVQFDDKYAYYGTGRDTVDHVRAALVNQQLLIFKMYTCTLGSSTYLVDNTTGLQVALYMDHVHE